MLLLLLVLVLVPLVDLYLLVVAERWLGLWPVLGFLVASLVIGGALARRQGRRIARGLAEARRAGRAPDEGMIGALLVAAAGGLLAWPGPLTTAAGLALLLPPVRRMLGGVARRWVERRMSVAIGFPGAGWPGDAGGAPPDEVIDVEPGEERRSEESGANASSARGDVIELFEADSPREGEPRSP